MIYEEGDQMFALRHWSADTPPCAITSLAAIFSVWEPFSMLHRGFIFELPNRFDC